MQACFWRWWNKPSLVKGHDDLQCKGEYYGMTKTFVQFKIKNNKGLMSLLSSCIQFVVYLVYCTVGTSINRYLLAFTQTWKVLRISFKLVWNEVFCYGSSRMKVWQKSSKCKAFFGSRICPFLVLCRWHKLYALTSINGVINFEVQFPIHANPFLFLWLKVKIDPWYKYHLISKRTGNGRLLVSFCQLFPKWLVQTKFMLLSQKDTINYKDLTDSSQ